MSTPPAFTKRDALNLDHLLGAAGGEGWAGLEPRQSPLAPKPMQPSDQLARSLARLRGTPAGEELIEWLMDITFRAPFRATGKTIEETALLAATRQGIEGVGEVILAAIDHGARLVELEQQARETE